MVSEPHTPAAALDAMLRLQSDLNNTLAQPPSPQRAAKVAEINGRLLALRSQAAAEQARAHMVAHPPAAAAPPAGASGDPKIGKGRKGYTNFIKDCRRGTGEFKGEEKRKHSTCLALYRKVKARQ